MRSQSTKTFFFRVSLTVAITLAGWSAPPGLFADDAKTDLKAQLSLSPSEASVAALAVVPNGKIKSVRLIWAFDITTPQSESLTAVQVDALTGKIITANTAFTEKNETPAPVVVVPPAPEVKATPPPAPVELAVNNPPASQAGAPELPKPASVVVADPPQAADSGNADLPRVQADINPNFDGVSLDGTKWKVTVTPDAASSDKGEKLFTDELIFADGKATSTACGQYGFTPSDYSTVDEGALVHWHAEQVSDKDGKTIWLGKVANKMMSGTLIWYKTDDRILHYSVHGDKE